MTIASRARASRLLSATILLAATAPPVLAQAANATRVTTVEGITEYSLPNGLRVLLFPDQSKPTITVNITYLVGSRHEGYGETGMAHLLEHLVFKGSRSHPNIPQELTDHGSRPNGTTWYDRTNYFETVPATDANLDWALDLEADRMVNSFIAKKDLDSEFSVVRNEFEAGENNPFRVTIDRVMDAAYRWHGYGRSTIGNKADIEGVPIDRLQAFYRKYYQPDNAVLVVAGRFDPAKTLAVIESKFGRIPRPERRAELGNLIHATYTVEPVQDGERYVDGAACRRRPGAHDGASRRRRLASRRRGARGPRQHPDRQSVGPPVQGARGRPAHVYDHGMAAAVPGAEHVPDLRTHCARSSRSTRRAGPWSAPSTPRGRPRSRKRR